MVQFDVFLETTPRLDLAVIADIHNGFHANQAHQRAQV